MVAEHTGATPWRAEAEQAVCPAFKQEKYMVISMRGEKMAKLCMQVGVMDTDTYLGAMGKVEGGSRGRKVKQWPDSCLLTR